MMKLRIKNILKENKGDRKDLMLKKLSSLIEPPLYREVRKIYPNIQENELKVLMEHYFNVDKVKIWWVENNDNYYNFQFEFLGKDKKTILLYKEYGLWEGCGISVFNDDYVKDDPVMDISFSEGVTFFDRGRDVIIDHPYDILNEIRNGTFDVGNYFNKDGKPKEESILNESIDKKDMMINRIVDILFDNTEWEFYPWGHEKNRTLNTGRDGLVTIWFYDRRDEDDFYFYGKKDVIEMFNKIKNISDTYSGGFSVSEIEEITHTYGLTEKESIMVLHRFAKRLWETLYNLYWNKDHIDYVEDYNR